MKKLLINVKVYFKIFYYKWVKGRCRHICCFCSDKGMCIDEVKYECGFYD